MGRQRKKRSCRWGEDDAAFYVESEFLCVDREGMGVSKKGTETASFLASHCSQDPSQGPKKEGGKDGVAGNGSIPLGPPNC